MQETLGRRLRGKNPNTDFKRRDKNNQYWFTHRVVTPGRIQFKAMRSVLWVNVSQGRGCRNEPWGHEGDDV